MIPTAKKSQRKGRGGELELAQVLQEYGYDVKPGRSQSYGAEPDLTGLPAVFHRRNRQEWLVTMRLSDWLEMYRKVPHKKGHVTRQKAAETAED